MFTKRGILLSEQSLNYKCFKRHEPKSDDAVSRATVHHTTRTFVIPCHLVSIVTVVQ
jgi:hypothetical protein